MIRRHVFALALLGALGAAALPPRDAFAQEGVDPAELKRELRRIPARTPAEALESFDLAGGLRIELVAAEPLVVDPVCLEFDERGRLWVVEMRDYPFTRIPDTLTTSPQARQQPAGSIRLLEDHDADGRMDASRVFAGDLAWPTGLALWRGGVFVASAPDILYFPDDNDDGVADRRRVVWTGFGIRNVQGLLNGLRWGIDNRVWGASGYNGGDVLPGDAAASAASVSVRGHDFRFNPTGGPLELVTTGGQFGLAFDAWGRRFVCSNSAHLRHVVIDGSYLDRNPYLAGAGGVADIPRDGAAAPVFRRSAAESWRVVRTRWRASAADARSRYAATELVPVGFFTSASGLTVYDVAGGPPAAAEGSAAFAPEYSGSVFVGDVGGNLVHRKVLVPRGATFDAVRPSGETEREFLTSSDNWFRPVSISVGPEGALYICDMYREVIEHPHSIPESIQQHFDLRSGNDRGRIWRVLPAGARDGGRRALRAARGLGRPSGETGGPAPATGERSSRLVEQLASHAGWWRRTAQRLLLERDAAEAVPALEALAREGGGALARIHALWTLEGLGALTSAHVRAALGDEDPRVREHGLRAGGRFFASSEALLPAAAALAADPDPVVRFQAALTLGAFPAAAAQRALVAIAASDGGDRWFRTALLTARADHAAAILSELFAEDTALRPHASLARPVAEVLGARHRPNDIALVLDGVARGLRDDRAEHSAQVLLGLEEGLRRAGRSLAELVEEESRLSQAAAPLEPILAEAAARAGDRETAEDDRVTSVRLLALAPYRLAARALRPLLDPRESTRLQLAAIRTLAGKRDHDVAELLLAPWSTYSPAVRREVIEAIFRRAERLSALLDAVDDERIAVSDLDPDRREQLAGHSDAALRARARALLGRSPAAATTTTAELARLEAALRRPGRWRVGRVVFRTRCATCHVLNGDGHAVGPDLATAKHRGREALLQHIVEPDREVLPAYIAYVAVTRDGQTFSGLIAGETANSITLRRAEGLEDSILRANLAKLESSGRSLMSEGLLEDLGVEEVADLLEFLTTPEPPAEETRR